MLEPVDIIELIKKPSSLPSLEKAKAIQDKHKLIVKGIGFEDQLKKRLFYGRESATLFKAKRLFARPATPGLMQKFINQFSKIFRAEGFNETFLFKGSDAAIVKEAKEFLSNIWGGKSLMEMMQHKWSAQLLEDFNGIYLVELPAIADKASEPEPYVVFYGIESIHDISEDDQGIEYVILKEAISVNGEQTMRYRYIDEQQDTIFIGIGDDLKVKKRDDGMPDTLLQIPPIIPAVRISHYEFGADFPELRVNYLHPGVELGEQYQDIKDDHVVAMKKHGYPLFYSKPITCPKCNGRKQIFNALVTSDAYPSGTYEDCMYCNTLGQVRFEKGDPTEGITIPVSMEPAEVGKAAEPPAGYVKNDIESLKAMGEEKEMRKQDVEEAILGTVGYLERAKTQDKTAYETFVNFQPVEDRMSTYTSNAEIVYNFLVNVLMAKRYGDKFISYTARFGRKYLIRNENEIQAQYQAAKNAGLPDGTLKEYLIEFVKTKFENNPESQARALFLLDLEPFPTYRLQELKSMGIADSRDMEIKLYFNDLVEQFERDNGDIMLYESNKDHGIRLNDIYAAFEDILTKWGITVAAPPTPTTTI